MTERRNNVDTRPVRTSGLSKASSRQGVGGWPGMLVLGQLLALDRESDATEYLHAASGEIVMKNCVQFMWR